MNEPNDDGHTFFWTSNAISTKKGWNEDGNFDYE